MSHTDRMGHPILFEDTSALKAPERAPLDHPEGWLQSKSDDWYTPAWVTELARQAMGSIDTDPASNALANGWIKAATWYTVENNGLREDNAWSGNVWLNPPYGKGDESAGKFAERLVREVRLGNVTQAITCLNLASTGAKWFTPIWEEARVHLIWRGRLNFYNPSRLDDIAAPNKGTVLSYFGMTPERFEKLFSPYGQLVVTR